MRPDRMPLPSVLGQVVDVLGEPRRMGDQELAWCCPFCVQRGHARDDTRYRLMVNPFKRESRGKFSRTGWFICYNCEAKGTVATLLRKLGIGVETHATSWDEMLTALVELGTESAPAQAEDVLAEFPCPVFKIIEGMESHRYLVEERGITPDVIESHELQVGSRRYMQRIFFPNYNASGELDFWSARSFAKDETGPKYLSSPGCPRKLRLYRYHDVLRALRRREIDSVTITEGVISAVRAGPDALASFGKFVSPEQVEMLAAMPRLAGRDLRFFVALDGDAQPYAFRLCRQLHARGFDVSFVNLPQEHDPASLPPEEWVALREAALPYQGALTEAALGLARVKVPHAPME